MKAMLPSSAARDRPGAEAVANKALLRAAQALAISSAVLAEVLGTSEATLSRVRSGARSIALGSKEGELALLFLRVFRSLDALMGGNIEHARAWLNAPNTHLRGIPLERLKTVQGLVDVAEYLDALRGAF
jgi:uncharacterized protein (DUF2384 family)